MPRPQSPPADGSPPSIPLLAGRFSGPFSGSNGAAAQQTPPGAGWLQELPLQGVTILAVEDSRFACEALRLIARRAGAQTFEIGAVHRDDVAEPVEIIPLDLPCGLPSYVDTIQTGDGDGTRIGLATDVIGSGSGRIDVKRKFLLQRRYAERTFRHR